MPWVRRYRKSNAHIWVTGILAGVCFGVFLAYQLWGSTAAVVAIVDKDLNSTEAHIADLENRVIRLEARLVSQESNPATVEGNNLDRKKADDLIHGPDADTADAQAETY